MASECDGHAPATGHDALVAAHWPTPDGMPMADDSQIIAAVVDGAAALARSGLTLWDA